MDRMTPEETRRFLESGTRTAKLATTREDGRPHVVPVWFVLDGDDIVFMTAGKSVKGRNLSRDPRVSLAVDEESPPFAFVMVEGVADVQGATPQELLDWATRIARRYMGDERAGAYGRRNGVPGELLVRVTPRNVVAVKGVSD